MSAEISTFVQSEIKKSVNQKNKIYDEHRRKGPGSIGHQRKARRNFVKQLSRKEGSTLFLPEWKHLRLHRRTVLKEKGYEVIGVSTDSSASHQKFIDKHELPFTLIADTDKKPVEAMGVWGEKSMCGKKYMGTFRTTFLPNEEGIVKRHSHRRK